MKTERVTLLISPDDKRQLQDLAEEHGMTASEFVRQAVQAYSASSLDETRELAALTHELREAIPDMRRSLREANAAAEHAISTLTGKPRFKAAEPRSQYRAGKR